MQKYLLFLAVIYVAVILIHLLHMVKSHEIVFDARPGIVLLQTSKGGLL